jgi:hypothetical protein
VGGAHEITSTEANTTVGGQWLDGHCDFFSCVEADTGTTNFTVDSTLVQGHEQFSSKVKVDKESNKRADGRWMVLEQPVKKIQW